MDSQIRQFDCSGEDVCERWIKWNARLDHFLSIKKITDNKEKIDYLFYLGGEDLEDLYDDKAQADTYEQVIEKLKAKFYPPSTSRPRPSTRTSESAVASSAEWSIRTSRPARPPTFGVSLADEWDTSLTSVKRPGRTRRSHGLLLRPTKVGVEKCALCSETRTSTTTTKPTKPGRFVESVPLARCSCRSFYSQC